MKPKIIIIDIEREPVKKPDKNTKNLI